MNQRFKILLAALAVPAFMAGSVQAQEIDNCNPVIDSTADPVVSSSGAIVSNSFTVPCPPVAAETPAPTPVERQSYLVFFDWDKSDITPTADQILAEAAEAIRGGAVAQVMVTGHTDTSGPTNYNSGLSDRRAAAVADRLIAYGVPATEIGTTGLGETSLRVPTPDGVREPQNRRAEIVLQ